MLKHAITESKRKFVNDEIIRNDLLEFSTLRRRIRAVLKGRGDPISVYNATLVLNNLFNEKFVQDCCEDFLTILELEVLRKALGEKKHGR